ncbi:MAG: hypothetical protein ACREOC_04785 [Gemmatimonadales bacterium]
MTEKPSPTQVAQQVQKQGAICLQGFFDPEAVAAMRGESVALLDKPVEGVSPEGNPGGSAVRIDPKLLEGPRFPGISRALRSDFFQRTARGYDAKSTFCFDAVITHDRVPCKITDVHFDMRRSLKFMIYLSDVRKENAAFRYAFGTHRANREVRHRFLLAGGKLNDLPNVPGPDEQLGLVDIEGPEGTLIVFDTDGFHSAGLLQAGKERLLIRSRTLLSGWYNSPVLRKAAELNPLRFFLWSPGPAGRKATGGSARAS